MKKFGILFALIAVLGMSTMAWAANEKEIDAAAVTDGATTVISKDFTAYLTANQTTTATSTAVLKFGEKVNIATNNNTLQVGASGNLMGDAAGVKPVLTIAPVAGDKTVGASAVTITRATVVAGALAVSRDISFIVGAKGTLAVNGGTGDTGVSPGGVVVNGKISVIGGSDASAAAATLTAIGGTGKTGAGGVGDKVTLGELHVNNGIVGLTGGSGGTGGSSGNGGALEVSGDILIEGNQSVVTVTTGTAAGATGGAVALTKGNVTIRGGKFDVSSTTATTVDETLLIEGGTVVFGTIGVKGKVTISGDKGVYKTAAANVVMTTAANNDVLVTNGGTFEVAVDAHSGTITHGTGAVKFTKNGVLSIDATTGAAGSLGKILPAFDGEVTIKVGKDGWRLSTHTTNTAAKVPFKGSLPTIYFNWATAGRAVGIIDAVGIGTAGTYTKPSQPAKVYMPAMTSADAPIKGYTVTLIKVPVGTGDAAILSTDYTLAGPTAVSWTIDNTSNASAAGEIFVTYTGVLPVDDPVSPDLKLTGAFDKASVKFADNTPQVLTLTWSYDNKPVSPVIVSAPVYNSNYVTVSVDPVNTSKYTITPKANNSSPIELRVHGYYGNEKVSYDVVLPIEVAFAKVIGSSDVKDPTGQPAIIVASADAAFRAAHSASFDISKTKSFMITGLTSGDMAIIPIDASFAAPVSPDKLMKIRNAGAYAYPTPKVVTSVNELGNGEYAFVGGTWYIAIKDGGTYDLDGLANGTVVDPLAVVKDKTGTPPGPGGGCNSGYLPFIVLLAAPLFFLRKKD